MAHISKRCIYNVQDGIMKHIALLTGSDVVEAVVVGSGESIYIQKGMRPACTISGKRGNSLPPSHPPIVSGTQTPSIGKEGSGH